MNIPPTIDQILKLYKAYSQISDSLDLVKKTLVDIDGQWEPIKHAFHTHLSSSLGRMKSSEDVYSRSLYDQIKILCEEACVISCCEEQVLLRNPDNKKIAYCEICNTSMLIDEWILIQKIEEVDDDENE